MGKVNSLFDITNRPFVKDKERKTVSEHCLEDPPGLDTNYLAKLKKLNKKKKVPIDDLLAVAMVNNHHKLPLAKSGVFGHRIAEIILKENEPLFTTEEFGDVAHAQKANLKTKIATNTASEQSNLLSEKQSIDCKVSCIHALQPDNIGAQQHVESTAAGESLDSDVGSLFVKDTEQENNETQKLPLSLIATTPSFCEQNNVLLAPINKHKTEDSKMSSTLNRSMTDTDNQFQAPKTSLSSEEGAMRYHFNKWQGDHSVKIQFDKIADHRIYLSPSNLIVEKQLSKHLNELSTKFKVHISDKNESYRYKQSKDEAYDEKDKE